MEAGRSDRKRAAEEDEEREEGEEKADFDELRAIQLSRTQLEDMHDKLFFEGASPAHDLHQEHCMCIHKLLLNLSLPMPISGQPSWEGTPKNAQHAVMWVSTYTHGWLKELLALL